MIDEKGPVARLSQVVSTWFVILVLALSWLGGSATKPAAFAIGSSAGLAGTMAQESVATLSTAWKAARAQEHRAGHDPDEFITPISPTALPESVRPDDVRQTDVVLRFASGTGLPQSRAPPLT